MPTRSSLHLKAFSRLLSILSALTLLLLLSACNREVEESLIEDTCLSSEAGCEPSETPEVDQTETPDVAPAGNTKPVAYDRSYSMDANSQYNFMLLAMDADDDFLTYGIKSEPKHGELFGEYPSITYQPDDGYVGEDSLQFYAHDGEVSSNVATISLTVQATVDPNAIKVILMAGQSNMQGNNTKLDSLQQLICHADKNYVLAGQTCGSHDISAEKITELFSNESAPVNDYNNPYSGDKNDAVNTKLGQFLCKVGKLDQVTCEREFDLTDRIFATVSDYYHTGSKYAYGNDAYKQMSTAMAAAQAYQDGFLNGELLNERNDVNVIQYTGALGKDNKTLSFSQRLGALTPDFGAKTNTYGPELMFGQYMGEHLKNDVLLLKVVQGGTDIRVDWKTPCSTQNSGNALTASELQQDSLYDALVQRAIDIQDPVKAAKLFPEYAGKTLEIAGFVWFQGWNDGLNDLNRDNYQTNMKCLVDDLRNDLNNPNLPIVIAQSHVGEADNGVQVGQANVAANTQDVNLSITDDLSGYYHFDSAAQLAIGQRMATAMKKLMP